MAESIDLALVPAVTAPRQPPAEHAIRRLSILDVFLVFNLIPMTIGWLWIGTWIAAALAHA